MRFVFLSYNYSPDIKTPEEWVNRINFYVGTLECLSETNTVIRVDQINYEGNFVHNGVQYFCVKAQKKENYLPWKLHQFVKRLRPDVVIVSSFQFPAQVIQLRFVLGKKIKIIIQNHAEKPFTGIKKYLQRLADRYIDAYLFVSHELGATWVKKGNLHSEKKIHEIMEVSSVFYPADKSEARLKTGVNGSPVFLWVGRLNANKDPVTVVKSFLKFSKIHATAKLYMIYQATELLKEVQELIAEDQYNPNSIVLAGSIPHKEMLYWFNSADFFISGSHYEGSGTAVCEAMSCGCIPIVTSIPSFKKINCDGKFGFLFEPGNPESLLKVLLNLKNIDKEKLSVSIVEHFNQSLSFKSIADDLFKTCEKLMTK